MSGADGARRAVAYIRLAGEASGAKDPSPSLSLVGPQAREVEGFEPQRRSIEAWAARESVTITAWQIDVGIDGGTPIAERPGLLAAYEALRAHRAGLLVAANADRFGEHDLVCWLIERAALSYGAAICTADGSAAPVKALERASSRSPASGDDSDVDAGSSAFTRGAVALASAYERVTLRARVRAAFAEKRARGERVGNVPYGFRLAADGVHVEPDDAEQAIVNTVRQLASEGFSHRGIVSQLAARGIAGRTGAPLRQTQVANILRG